ncbi:helix-turn-helix domain-containing protein [Actinocatenispora rupis]|nr:AraC family transcriptional regulator [Actinocatenispora rupis]
MNPGRMVYHGTLGDIPMHSSIAIGIVLVVAGEVELRGAADEAVRLSPDGPNAAILPAGVPHAKPVLPSEATTPARLVMAIVDPDSPAGRVLAARLGADHERPADWIRAAKPCQDVVRAPEPDDPAGVRVVDAVIAALASEPTAPAPPLHPGLRRAAELIPARLSSGVELRDLAAEVGLSASRLGHLFAVQLGLPYRAYVRWARLQKVVEVLRDGGTLTSAAHAAGFTDSAHMNRICRSVFGVNPSTLIQYLVWV